MEDPGAPDDRPTPAAPEPSRLLRLYAWARLGLAELLLVIPLLPAHLRPETNFQVLVVALAVVALSSGGLLLLGRTGAPGRTARLVALLDLLVVTALVTATGGPRSVFAFLYVLVVVAACLLLSRAGALAVAGTASLLYAVVVVVRAAFPLAAALDRPVETAALELLTMLVNAATFLVVALVAGGLAERYRAASRALQAQRRDLAELQAFKALILHSVGAGLIVLDPDHVVTALNRAAEALTGQPAARALGRPWTALFGPDLSPHAIEGALAGGGRGPARGETTVCGADGRRRPVRLTFSALHSAGGGRLGFIVVCEDLSALRELEGRVREADRLATLGRLAASIAHEIRNPLASLTGAVEALNAEAAPGPDRERLAQIVARESERLNRIIGDLLAYARPAPLAPETVDVADLVDEILVLLRHRGLPAGCTLIRDVPARLPWPVDPQRLRQALWNLCLNALEAMPAGGELRVSAQAAGDGLTLTVADTGRGIAETERPHVFEPFFSTKPGGSGLGLALVHRIVGDHGGHIELDSRPGRGTTVVLRLPAGLPVTVPA